MKIKDSVAFVTGANRGLGLALVYELLARGANRIRALRQDFPATTATRCAAAAAWHGSKPIWGEPACPTFSR